MKNSAFFFLFFFLTNAQHLHSVYANDYLSYICGSTGNETEKSTSESNLSKLFTSLSTEAVALEGFGTYTIAVPDQISALVLCRGDVNTSVCGNCLNQSTSDIQTLCPSSKEATIWYDFCLLHYSNNDFLSSTDNSQQVTIWTSENVTSQKFNGWTPLDPALMSYVKTTMKTLLNDVAYQAAYDSSNHFGIRDANLTSSIPVIYSMSQCTPDMLNDACHACLQDLINQMLNNFDGRQGGRILGVRCSLRYETYNFLHKYEAVLLPLSTTSEPVKPVHPHAVAGNRPAPAPLPTPRPHSLSIPTPTSTPTVPDDLLTPSPSKAVSPFPTNKGINFFLVICLNHA